MAAKPYRPKMTAAEKKAYKNRNFGSMGKTGGMGGKYGRKSENLSKKQLKASGGLAASKKRTVDISQTRREGAVTLGPGGKPLTGTVNLGNGKTAVYKGGKRVQATPKSQMKPKGGSGTSRPRTTTSRVTPSARGEGAGSVRPGITTSRTNLTPSAAKILGRARGQASRGSAQAGRQASTISATGRPMSTPSYTTKSNKPTTTTSSGGGSGKRAFYTASVNAKSGKREGRWAVQRNGKWYDEKTGKEVRNPGKW